jgi:hypothetical protein
MLDPDNPADAQGIVAAYLKLVEAHASADVYPGSLRDLPHPKETIRSAFKTTVTTLVSTAGQLTAELREYLEIACVSLADYVDDESATLLREYTHAGEELAADSRLARERVMTDAWRRVTEQSTRWSNRCGHQHRSRCPPRRVSILAGACHSRSCAVQRGRRRCLREGAQPFGLTSRSTDGCATRSICLTPVP